MTLQMQVGDNVRVLAAAKGTSPGGVAVEIGRSRQWMQNKLAGRAGWSVADVEAVAAALGVDVTVLMTTDWWPEELLRACRDSNPKPSGLSFARWLRAWLQVPALHTPALVLV